VRRAALLCFLRTAGAFLLNVLIALFGTARLESPFDHFALVASSRQSLFNEDLLNGVFAFGVGYSVFRMWRAATSKWVWIAGLCWFGRKVLPGGGHVVFWETAATKSVFLDIPSLVNWSIYTLPCLRTLFYSAGAFCSSRFSS
jgi:hypothetical protein